MNIPIALLGQSGCRLELSGQVLYVDPYLSNSVQLLDSPDLSRQVPITVVPEEVTDADFVLITHEHMDHCDPHTLPQIAEASSNAIFVAPPAVISILLEWGIANNRLQNATEGWMDLAPGLKVHAIPAAHPEIARDDDGNLIAVGYLVDSKQGKIYFAGDTFVRQEIIDLLNQLGPIKTAFLPVNEHNFFRERRGIIGNMSVREAFQFAEEIKAGQVVPVHWDMFSVNSVDPEEIRLIYQHIGASFQLLFNPSSLSTDEAQISEAQISIVIRTLNEEKYLNSLLSKINEQKLDDGLTHEVILVDSGSTDSTLEIARQYGCRIFHIERENFSFGRSLNLGCENSLGDYVVIISGHCVPVDEHWLQNLCQPLVEGCADYVYGRQVGGDESYFSEKRVFEKYFPASSKVPQVGFYCNNANSALRKDVWARYRFDEEITGLEDMELAKRLVDDGGLVAYVSDAAAYHNHSESWYQVRRRYEREAIALQKIMPQVHVGLLDTIRYFIASVLKDTHISERPVSDFLEVFLYRWNQYWGAYKGNHQHRILSRSEKEKYFFPK